MADPDSYAILFKRALAQHLHDSEAGIYKAVGSYTATERGIYTNGPTLPTTGDNCIVLTWLSPIPDGRGDMIYRVQTMTRVKGSGIAADNAAAVVKGALDQKQNVPFADVSWCALFSELAYTADASGRCAVAQTWHFTGRRQLP